MNASLKALNTREMLDVRQQAEFFMTLGQHEDAIGMLKDSIDGSPDSNPLVYLDLLRLLHTLGRKTEFDQYRDDFNALFTVCRPIPNSIKVRRDWRRPIPTCARKSVRGGQLKRLLTTLSSTWCAHQEMTHPMALTWRPFVIC